MRLVTRADFDGLVCGALVTKFEKIDDYLYVEPKFMQDGLVEIRRGDIIANLPYHPNCTLWFDHHITNTTPELSNSRSCSAKAAFASRPAPRASFTNTITELAQQACRQTGNSKIRAREEIRTIS